MRPIGFLCLAMATAVQVIAKSDITPVLTAGRRSSQQAVRGVSLIPRQFSDCACYDAAFGGGGCGQCTRYSSGACECPSYATNNPCNSVLNRCQITASGLGQTCPSLSCDVAELSGDEGQTSICPSGQQPCGTSGELCISEKYICCGTNSFGQPLACSSGQVCNSDGTCGSGSVGDGDGDRGDDEDDSVSVSSFVSAAYPSSSYGALAGTSTESSTATTTAPGNVRTTGSASSWAGGVSGQKMWIGFVGAVLLL
ncbi:hypothetical protein QBC37DRAFT_405540 [Rhypophila decipiens]|uniref:GPI anchored protein n=1 Tax=Rhypophila decipiens TaxID=261697 RepID=A0AAN6XX08_9PEZI|nr:hypothetical protein QBC37DRAFT_405540 [Rhypophila decipiens]